MLLIAVLTGSILIIKNNTKFLFTTREEFLLFSLPIVWVVSTKITNLYDEFRAKNFSYELITIIKNVIIQGFAAIVIIFFLKEKNLSRSFIFIYTITLLFSVSIEKFAFRQIFKRIRKKGRNLRNVLIIGAGKVGWSFYQTILMNPHFGYKLAGFLDDKRYTYLNGEYLGCIEEIDNVLSSTKIDDIVIALPNSAENKIEEILTTCDKYTSKVKIIPDYFKFVSDRYNVSMFGQFPIVSIRNDNLNELHWRLLKRGFDTIFTLCVFIFIFSWLWPIIFILQKIFNPGPVLYKAKRWGRDGKEFICYKFRSMVPTCSNRDNDGQHRYTIVNDPRVTPFGKFLRRSNLDELPQFINVLKGEMSLVGPRPHDSLENIKIKGKIKSYMWRHTSKPGLTGWAQIHGYRGGTSDMRLMAKRTELDIWYIENWSFWLDIQIIILTVWHMLKGDPHAY